MFKSYIYLEIRVLLSAMPGVFIEEGGKDGPKKEQRRADVLYRTYSAVCAAQGVYVRACDWRQGD